MALPYEIFVIGYSATIVSATIAALLFFVGLRNIKASIIILSIKKNWPLILAIVLLPSLLLIESRFTPLLESEAMAARNVSWMLSHGGEVIRYIQNRLEVGLITDIFIFIYVWLFTFIIYFTPIYLLAKNDTVLFKKYSIAMILNYLVLLPFYLFIPVSVASEAPSTMLKPLLYMSTNWGKFVTSMDPLDNGFPSGHISLLLTTLLILSSSYFHRRYTHFMMWGLIAITVAVLYLGIHWIVDILGGIALSVSIVLIVGNTRLVGRQFPRSYSEFAEKAGGGPEEEMSRDEAATGERSISSEERLRRIFRKTR